MLLAVLYKNTLIVLFGVNQKGILTNDVRFLSLNNNYTWLDSFNSTDEKLTTPAIIGLSIGLFFATILILSVVVRQKETKFIDKKNNPVVRYLCTKKEEIKDGIHFISVRIYLHFIKNTHAHPTIKMIRLHCMKSRMKQRMNPSLLSHPQLQTMQPLRSSSHLLLYLNYFLCMNTISVLKSISFLNNHKMTVNIVKQLL